jgi:hypothetical protein
MTWPVRSPLPTDIHGKREPVEHVILCMNQEKAGMEPRRIAGLPRWSGLTDCNVREGATSSSSTLLPLTWGSSMLLAACGGKQPPWLPSPPTHADGQWPLAGVQDPPLAKRATPDWRARRSAAHHATDARARQRASQPRRHRSWPCQTEKEVLRFDFHVHIWMKYTKESWEREKMVTALNIAKLHMPAYPLEWMLSRQQ